MAASLGEVLGQLVQWSASQPMWQRDALRRLFEKGELDDADLDQLVTLAKASHGLNGAGVMQGAGGAYGCLGLKARSQRVSTY